MDPEWFGTDLDYKLNVPTSGDGNSKDHHMQNKLINIVCDRMAIDNDEHLTTTLRFSNCVEIHEDGDFAKHPALKLILHSDDYFGTSSDLRWYVNPFAHSEGIVRLKENAHVEEITCVCPSPAAVLIKVTSMPLPQTFAILEEEKTGRRLVSFGYVACDEPSDRRSVSSTLATFVHVSVQVHSTGIEGSIRLL